MRQDHHGSQEVNLPLDSTRRDSQNHRQSSYDKRSSRKCRERDTSPARRKLAPDNPVLALEVAVETHDKDEDGNADEC